uniref:MADF domain-containing protein n=1 Tax=Timema bartmani TaxID=61472 RepID=A0A7R9F2F2_9NEOP|nr:unnamed protein product [Timema bartmani]
MHGMCTKASYTDRAAAAVTSNINAGKKTFHRVIPTVNEVYRKRAGFPLADYQRRAALTCTINECVFTDGTFHSENRRPIWDKKEKSHSNRNIVEKCWMEISLEMGVEENTLRKKWKYIRDQFCVELGKIPPSRSGDTVEGSPTSKWAYFKSLLFLKDSVKPRASCGNLPNPPTGQTLSATIIGSSHYGEPTEDFENSQDQEEISDEEAVKQLKETDVLFQPTQSTLSMTTPTTKKKKRQCADTYNETLLNIEKEKMQYLQEMSEKKRKSEIEDEDLLFFKSLLSHVRKIPASRKLYFRSQVQELVEQFAYNQESSSSSIFHNFHSYSSSPSTYPTDSFPNANNSSFPV